MDYGIKGKNAIVVGGFGGLGYSIAKILLQEGANVAIGDMVAPEEKFDALKKEFPNQKIVFIKTDVSSEASDINLIKESIKELGSVELFSNSVAIWPTGRVVEITEESWNKTMQLNLTGAFILNRELVKYWLQNNIKGKIVNVTSQAAFHGSTSGHAHYAASKAGLVTFSISLAREVAPEGINVNLVAPGIMRSPMTEEVLKDPKRKDAYLERIPVRRIAETDDVAKAVVFLLSTQADYMTGTTLDLTGGMLMR